MKLDDIGIKEWININGKDKLSILIEKIETNYVVITNDYIKHPPHWIERLLYYFKWYPGTEAVNAFSNQDDYLPFVEKYFPYTAPFDYENITHKFRHFIGADLSSEILNSQCFAIKAEMLKKINFNNSDIQIFVNVISEELHNRKCKD